MCNLDVRYSYHPSYFFQLALVTFGPQALRKIFIKCKTRMLTRDQFRIVDIFLFVLYTVGHESFANEANQNSFDHYWDRSCEWKNTSDTLIDKTIDPTPAIAGSETITITYPPEYRMLGGSFSQRNDSSDYAAGFYINYLIKSPARDSIGEKGTVIIITDASYYSPLTSLPAKAFAKDPFALSGEYEILPVFNQHNSPPGYLRIKFKETMPAGEERDVFLDSNSANKLLENDLQQNNFSNIIDSSYLVCSRIDAVPYPRCDLVFYKEPFVVEASFLRDELSNIDELISSSKSFISCITANHTSSVEVERR